MLEDVFGDPDALHAVWESLKMKFDADEEMVGLRRLPVIVLCYNGETSQVATSMLRAKGYEAFSICGGFSALRESTLSQGQNGEDV